MSTGAELGQHILQTQNSKKFRRFNGGLNPRNLRPLGTLVALHGSESTEYERYW